MNAFFWNIFRSKEQQANNERQENINAIINLIRKYTLKYDDNGWCVIAKSIESFLEYLYTLIHVSKDYNLEYLTQLYNEGIITTKKLTSNDYKDYILTNNNKQNNLDKLIYFIIEKIRDDKHKIYLPNTNYITVIGNYLDYITPTEKKNETRLL